MEGVRHSADLEVWHSTQQRNAEAFRESEEAHSGFLKIELDVWWVMSAVVMDMHAELS